MMTQSMIERVSRALCWANGMNPDLTLGGDGENFLWHEYEHEARAALEAMRKPTDKMLYWADGWSDLVGPYAEANTPEERRREFACAWDAMIDAALSEETE